MTSFRNRPNPDFIAEVRFLPAEEGGRQGPVHTGYRADQDFGVLDNGVHVLNGGEHVFQATEWLQLGEVAMADVRMVVPEYQFGRLSEGFTYTIQEGARVVGHGKIVEIIDQRMLRLVPSDTIEEC